MDNIIPKRNTYQFYKNIIAGHNNNKLCVKHKTKLSKLIHNNVGVFQGSPISAQLFIIYADSVMNDYKKEINNKHNTENSINIRNIDVEYNWSKYKLQKIIKKNQFGKSRMNINLLKQKTIMYSLLMIQA